MAKVKPSGEQRERVKVSHVYKGAVVLAFVSLVLIVVASGLPDWLTYSFQMPPLGLQEEIRTGVFYACSKLTGCVSDKSDIPDWMLISGTLNGGAIVFNFATLVIMVVHWIKVNESWASYVKYTSVGTILVTWIFVFATDFMFVSNADNVYVSLPEFDIDFALVMSICGGIFAFLVGVLLLIDISIQIMVR